jgi:hypothetical protein
MITRLLASIHGNAAWRASVTASTFLKALLLVNLRYLAAHQAWQRTRDAVQAWQVIAKDIRADARTQLFEKQLYDEKIPYRGGSARTYNYSVKINGVSTNRHLSPPQVAALEEIQSSKAGLFTSAKVRLDLGEVELQLREKLDPRSEWFSVPAERLGEYRILPDSVQSKLGRIPYHFRVRDLVGLPMDQAVQAYGNPSVLKELNFLAMSGAPDRVGRTHDLRPAIEEWVLGARGRFRELEGMLKAELLGKLAAGELVGNASGMVIPRSFWESVDATSDPAIWRPGTLVRPTGESDLVAPPQPTLPKMKAGVKPIKSDDALLLEIEIEVAAGIDQATAIKSRMLRINGASDPAKIRRFERKLKDRREGGVS